MSVKMRGVGEWRQGNTVKVTITWDKPLDVDAGLETDWRRVQGGIRLYRARNGRTLSEGWGPNAGGASYIGPGGGIRFGRDENGDIDAKIVELTFHTHHGLNNKRTNFFGTYLNTNEPLDYKLSWRMNPPKQPYTVGANGMQAQNFWIKDVERDDFTATLTTQETHRFGPPTCKHRDECTRIIDVTLDLSESAFWNSTKKYLDITNGNLRAGSVNSDRTQYKFWVFPTPEDATVTIATITPSDANCGATDADYLCTVDSRPLTTGDTKTMQPPTWVLNQTGGL